ncbi:MAG: DNA gyrase inhibitor YacG [Nitrosomonadales bacterium SCN 54-20]|nr:MAG: DNA gyrase inhibitor YacG [Nitrosomonadales bacterium SCN 54-20]
MKRPVVNCPQCGKSIVWDNSNPFRPFCSERCKLIDLGQWATESYRIPDTEKDPEKQESDPSGSEK